MYPREIWCFLSPSNVNQRSATHAPLAPHTTVVALKLATEYIRSQCRTNLWYMSAVIFCPGSSFGEAEQHYGFCAKSSREAE